MTIAETRLVVVMLIVFGLMFTVSGYTRIDPKTAVSPTGNIAATWAQIRASSNNSLPF
jgi:hypothetical protein